MSQKYFGGTVQEPSEPEELDFELKKAVSDAVDSFCENMDGLHVADASEAVFSIFRRANKYIDETTPWLLSKEEGKRGRLGTVLYNLLETIRIGAVLLAPLMPDTTDKILKLLSTEEKSLDFGALKPGTVLGDSEVLFARIDEKSLIEQIES